MPNDAFTFAKPVYFLCVPGDNCKPRSQIHGRLQGRDVFGDYSVESVIGIENELCVMRDVFAVDTTFSL